MKPQKTPNSQSNLEKKEQSERYPAPRFQTRPHKAIVIKTVWPGTKVDPWISGTE